MTPEPTLMRVVERRIEDMYEIASRWKRLSWNHIDSYPSDSAFFPKTTASFTVSTGLKPSARRATMVVAWLSSAFKTISRGL